MKNSDQLIELIGFIYSSGSGIFVMRDKKYFISYPYTKDFTEEISEYEFANLYYIEEKVFFRTIEDLVRYLKILFINDKYQNKKLALFESNEKEDFGKKSETFTIPNEILELPRLQSINVKLRNSSAELIEDKIGEIFTPLELITARALLENYHKRKRTHQLNLNNYNLSAITFEIIDFIEKKDYQDIILLGDLFLECLSIYEEKFHMYLQKYRAIYDPFEHVVFYNHITYSFQIETKTFKTNQNNLSNKYVKRIETIKELM